MLAGKPLRCNPIPLPIDFAEVLLGPSPRRYPVRAVRRIAQLGEDKLQMKPGDVRESEIVEIGVLCNVIQQAQA
jgi:hypothetical protein